NREDSDRLLSLRTRLQQFLYDEIQQDAEASYAALRAATYQKVRTELIVTLALLVISLIAAGVVSTLVARRVVRGEEVLRESREELQVTLGSIGDAVITTDAEGRVRMMNAVAESLTGWRSDDARGRPLEDVFRVVNEQTRKPVEMPVQKVLAEGHTVGLANHTVLVARDGTE